MGLRRVCADVRFLGSYPRADRGPAREASERDAAEKDAIYRDAAAWLGRIRTGRSGSPGPGPGPCRGERSRRRR